MKVIPVGLASNYAGGSSTIAFALRVDRGDGLIVGFTSADHDDEIGGVDYLADPGLNISEIVQTASFAVDNMKLRTLNDGTVFSKLDIMSGLWKDAEFALFKYDHATPANGIEDVMSGVFGQPKVSRQWIEVELRDLKQYGQQTVGAPSMKTCRNRLGVFDGLNSWCTVYMPPLTVDGVVSSVVSHGEFYDATRLEVDDQFGNGVLIWTVGANAGLRCVVKTHELTSNGGRFVLDLPMFRTISPGDEYTVATGCRLRRDEDCLDKFDNVLEFNGEPDRPLVNDVLQLPEPNV